MSKYQTFYFSIANFNEKNYAKYLTKNKHFMFVDIFTFMLRMNNC